MVVREYINCSTCEKKYILRVGVGLEKNCIHTFDCLACNVPIAINLCTNPPQAWVQSSENCQIRSSDDTDSIVINLHPSFAFDKAKLHQEQYFVSLEYTAVTAKHVRLRPGRFQDYATQFEVPNCKNIWPTVKQLLLLHFNGDPQNVVSKLLNQYNSARNKYSKYNPAKNPIEAASDFFNDIFYPKIVNNVKLLDLAVEKAKNINSTELSDLKTYHSTELLIDNFRRYCAIFDAYFKNYDQYRQLLVHARTDLPEFEEKVVGSKNFNEISLFYGQAFETLTSSYTLIACLNNILCGRPYSQFQSMSLSKFINDVDKSKKSNPFKNTPELSFVTEFEDGTLRNGSHHASIWREGEKIFYRSGGTGMERDITYSEYLHKCNGSAITIASIFLAELGLLSPA